MPTSAPVLMPALAANLLASPSPVPPKPAPQRNLSTASASKPAKRPKQSGILSLEDTIQFTTALTILRGPFLIVHVEVTGPSTEADSPGEILAISAMQVDEGVPVSEFSVRVRPLRALPVEPGMGRADEHGVTLQKAMTQLCEFLGGMGGSHRFHQVFTHSAAATQAILGHAARQYGLQIENPVGDVVDLAKLTWPDRTDYSLSGLAPSLLWASSELEVPNATKAILDVLLATSEALTANGGRVSKSILHWGTSAACVQIKPTPW